MDKHPHEIPGLGSSAEVGVGSKPVPACEHFKDLSPEATCRVLQDLDDHRIELQVQHEELQRAYLELDAERERYFEFYNLAPVGFLTVNEAGLILEANLTASALLGVALGALVGQPISLFIQFEHQDLFGRFRRDLLASGQPQAVDLRLLRKGGPSFWARLRANLIHSPEGECQIRLVASDITERKETEKERETYFNFFKLSIDPMCIADPLGCFLRINPAFTTLTGFTEAELLARPFLDFVHPEDRQRTLEEMTLQMSVRPSLAFENRYICRDGRIVLLSWTAFYDQNDGVTYGTARDITERRRAEEEHHLLEAEFFQSQKMDSLGSLAGGVAHDMNNALSAILASAETQLQKLPPQDPSHPAFETIIKASLRARTLVLGLLSFARKGVAEKRELNLNDLILEEVQLLEHATMARVRFQVDLDPELQPIRGDASALSHVLMNLCVNAIDAMEGLPGDRLLTLRSRNVGEQVEVDVEDIGSGMSKEVLARALEPFYTTKPQGKGTGLGLSIVFGTIQAHSGNLELRSEPGKGTCVRMRFPACLSSARQQDMEPYPPDPAAPNTLGILLVDDDELVRVSLASLLEMDGHKVTLASSGEAALDALASGLGVDVVILDLNMPGMGGADTLPRIRALYPALPIVLATGRVEQVALNLVQAHPHVTLLPKPFGLGEIRWHLEHLA